MKNLNSEDENDFSSSKDYSEEQGRKAFHFGISSQNKSWSIISKSESRRRHITKSTVSSINSSIRKPKAKSFNGPNKIFTNSHRTNYMHKRNVNVSGYNRENYCLNSLESNSNIVDPSVIVSSKSMKFKKLSKEQKLESIFRIYNRHDMLQKLNELKNKNTGKVHKHHYSVNDYDYDTTSLKVQKVETKHRRLNAYSFDSKKKRSKLSPDWKEVDAHLETTPFNSSKRLPENQGLSPLRESPMESSFSSFNGAWDHHSKSEKKPSKRLHNSINAKNDVHFNINNEQMRKKKLTPLRSGRTTANNFNSGRREKNSENFPKHRQDFYKTRLSNIYVRKDTSKEKITYLSNESSVKQRYKVANSKNNDTIFNLNETIYSLGYSNIHNPSVNLTKPMERNKLRQQIWRLPGDRINYNLKNHEKAV